MSARASIGFGVIGVAAALAGCLSTSVDNTGPQSAGALSGRVTRIDGAAVSGALLSFTVTTVPVQGVAQLLGTASALSGPDGSYAEPLIIGISPGAVDVEIQVTPPIGSLLLPVDTTDIAVQLDSSFPPRDTTVVQIVLRGR